METLEASHVHSYDYVTLHAPCHDIAYFFRVFCHKIFVEYAPYVVTAENAA